MKREINFFGGRFIGLAISTILILASIAVVAIMGIQRGVQFVGGTEIQVKFQDEVAIGDMRGAFVDAAFKNATIVKVEGENEFIIKLKGEEGDETRKDSDVVKRVTQVFMQVSGEETREGFDLNKINATDLAYNLRQANP